MQKKTKDPPRQRVSNNYWSPIRPPFIPPQPLRIDAYLCLNYAEFVPKLRLIALKYTPI